SRKKWHDQALQMFEKAVRIRPMSPDLHYDWGKALLRAGRYADAIPIFQRVVKLNPQHPKAAKKIAKIEQLLESRGRHSAQSPAVKSPTASQKKPKPAAAPQVLAYDSKVPPPSRPVAAPAPRPQADGTSIYIPPEDREMLALQMPKQEAPVAEMPAPVRRDPLADWPLEPIASQRAVPAKSGRLWMVIGGAAAFVVIAIAVIAWLQPWKSRTARPAEDAAAAKPAVASDPLAQALDDLRQPNSQRRREACGRLAQMELKE